MHRARPRLPRRGMPRRGGPRRLALALVLGLMSAAPPLARAEPLVLESYVGERPREAELLLSPLRSALAQHGFVVEPAAIAKVLRGYRTLPSISETGVTARQLNEAFERAHGDWLDGRIDRAATRLEAAITIAHRAPSLLALEQKTRDLSFTALLSLAQARDRQRQADKSAAAMAELIRSFPEQLITRGEHGPEAYELYRAVRRDLDTQGRGGLIVKVDVPSVIFLDEVPRTQDGSGARIADLVAGEYRVLVQSAQEPTSVRYYKVPVYAHQITRLDVSWELDSVLVTGDWVGFRFASSLGQAKEGEVALRVARETSAPAVATLRVEVTRQGKLIEASLYARHHARKTCAGRVRLTGRASDAVYVAGLADMLGSCLQNAREAERAGSVKKRIQEIVEDVIIDTAPTVIPSAQKKRKAQL